MYLLIIVFVKFIVFWFFKFIVCFELLKVGFLIVSFFMVINKVFICFGLLIMGMMLMLCVFVKVNN